MKRAATGAIAITADQLLASINGRCIVSGSQQLDGLLGNCGLNSSSGLIEISGCPGVGKSQVCIQLAVNTAIPGEFYGFEKRAIYIDTEGSFSATRCHSMARGLGRRLRCLADRHQGNLVKAAQTYDPQKVLDGVLVFSPRTEEQLLATILKIGDSWETNFSDVGLIIVDSIAQPFRTGQSDARQRLRVLTCIASVLEGLAVASNCAVVLTNQATTRFNVISQEDYELVCNAEGCGALVPTLGESWAHIPARRIWLEKHPMGWRTARNLGVSADVKDVQFLITEEGICDVNKKHF